MTPERWQQISRIFKSAISLDSEARAAYLKAQCSGDDSLRADVENLLASHRQASEEDFIGGLAAEAAAPLLIDDADGSTPQTLRKGQQFGSYVVLDSIGAGGMGEVYLARDTRLDRTVALKVLSADVSRDKRRMQRFLQEAKVASSLNQPNILTIFEFGEVEGLTFIATEFIDGDTLRHHLHHKKLKIGEVLDICIQVLAALDVAHDAAIVHRDIKPENIMIRRRDHVVKVLDFGLAKATEKKVSMIKGEEDSEAVTAFKTAPGIIMGTPNYMSPEQAQAKAVDVRTDIWSTGVMIYEMASGAMPFRGPTMSHTIVQILEKEPAPLANVPAELQRIVTKAISKDPDERYQTAKDMLIDLRALKKRMDAEAEIKRTSSPTMPAAPIVTDAIDQKSSKTKVLVIALLGMAGVTAAIFGVNMWRSARARTTPPVTAPAVAPVEQRTLTYWVTVQKYRDGKPYQNPFTLPGEINFEAGYRIRINIRSAQSGHLYILSEGPPDASAQTQFVALFPSTTANEGASLLPADQLVQIPQKSWFQFDQQQGTEKLWLVFASYEVPELEAVKEFASTRTQGLITDPGRNRSVQQFLNAHSGAKPQIEKGDTGTTITSSAKEIVYAVKLEHH